jgi:DNA-binding LacI/PurR family transcriptional regulator
MRERIGRFTAIKKTNSRKDRARPLRYEQARCAVLEYIRAHDLRSGDRLPTEEELRREFGWSRVTISRALNELVWDGVLRRVQGSGTYVAEPRPVDRAYRILVSSRAFPAEDDYGGPLFAGIRKEAAAQQVDIVYYDKSGVPTAEVVRDLGVDAVLALSWETDDLRSILSLHRAGLTVVGLALRSRTFSLPLVSTENFEGVCKAVEHLLDEGHRRIAFVTRNIQNSDVMERYAGLQHAMARAGQPVDPFYLLITSRHMDASLLEAWWQSMTVPPTALVLDGSVAARMLSLLLQHGVKIPEDLSVIVIDEVQAVQHFVPALTVLRQPTYELGRRALAKVLQMLRGEDDGAPEVLATELIPRDSVAAPKQDLREAADIAPLAASNVASPLLALNG